MKIISFNTGRLYQVAGQQIVAAVDAGTVYFKDCSRGIVGRFELSEFEQLSPRLVMREYDANSYQMASLPPAVAAAIAATSLAPLHSSLKI